MHPFVDTIHQWVASHIVTTLLIGLFVSIYGQDIRGFLHTWPVKTAKGYQRNKLENRLRLLESLHGNTFNLVLYVALRLASTVTAGALWYLLFQALVWATPPHRTYPRNYGVFLGVALGSAWELQRVLTDLINYDEKTKEWRERLAELTT